MRSSLPILLALSFVAPVYAWHDAGHKLTAALAFGYLNEEQRGEIAAVLRAHPRFEQDFAAAMPDDVAYGSEHDRELWLFQQASIWPDLVPDNSDQVRDHYHRATWHYINLPVYLTERDEKEFAGKLDQNVSMKLTPPLRRGLNIVQALKGNLRVWGTDDASDSEKAVALCWIVHLTGDMHQPLHNVALFSKSYFPDGDGGGNSITVVRQPENTNLHSAWDGLLNDVLQIVVDEQTRELLAGDVADFRAVSRWSRHGHELAKEFVYTTGIRDQILAREPDDDYPLVSLSPDYIDAARKLAHSQVIIAGHRIAALIAKEETNLQ